MSSDITPLANDFPAADAARWRGLVDKILKGADFEKRLVSKTADGLRIEPLYLRDALAQVPEPGQPGAAPYLSPASRAACAREIAGATSPFFKAAIVRTNRVSGSSGSALANSRSAPSRSPAAIRWVAFRCGSC